MSSRDDIPNRLIYTCNCGWVDKGHANPRSPRPHLGAQSLWNQIVHRTGQRTRWPYPGNLVVYRQEMWALGGLVGAVTEGRYLVAENLSRPQMESVALAIFLEISYRFESSQRFYGLGGLLSTSGFSEEDLVSNLIGFYTVVRPGVDYLRLCRPVSADASRAVWDANGGLGMNRTTEPVFHPCDECSTFWTGRFPPALRAIAPARKGRTGGNLFRNWQGTGFG